jgi:hypothetical protein
LKPDTQLDLRWPLGIFFTLAGLVLVREGLVAAPQVAAKTLGINLTLYWGAVLAVFGALSLGFALRHTRRTKRS